MARNLEVLQVSYIIALLICSSGWCTECQDRHSSRKW